jgi:hypothetical protein
MIFPVPGIRSRSHCRDSALRIAHVTPSPKSPAPALAIANAVELGGLHVEMAEPCGKTNTCNVLQARRLTELEGPVVDPQVESGGLQEGPLAVDCERATSRMEITPPPSLRPPPSPSTVGDVVLDELGGLKETPRTKDKRREDMRVDEKHTFEMLSRMQYIFSSWSSAPASVAELGRPREKCVEKLAMLDQQHAELHEERARTLLVTGESQPHIRSNDPFSPLLFPAVKDSKISIKDTKIFALVSAIIRTYWITYLAWTSSRELEPCLAWAREGIGTARSGS